MEDVPLVLLEGLSPPAVADVRAWWSELPDTTRHEIIFLWDERHDLYFFPPKRDDSGVLRWVRTPKVIGGRFVARGNEIGKEEWREEYFDHLLSNPELINFEPPVRRTFFIGCTAHETLRLALATGEIPADFECPFDSPKCPMHRLSNCE